MELLRSVVSSSPAYILQHAHSLSSYWDAYIILQTLITQVFRVLWVIAPIFGLP